MSKRSKKHSSKRIYLISTAIFISLASITLFLYDFYHTHYYDSSLDGSEIVEIQHNTVPEDIKQIVKSNQQNLQTSQEVLPAITFRIPIFLYHYVEYVKDKGDKTRISLDTPPYILEEQIKTLIQAKYTFMTNSELAEALNGRFELPSRPIVLTFDDGYEDFYTDVLPILKKYHVKVTAYIITGFMNRPNHLSDSEVKEIIDSGLVEIGAHTMHHTWLKGRNMKEVANEVTQSKTELEKQFDIQVVSFAYPFGVFDKQAMEAVKNAGLKSAVSTIPGIEQSKENEFFLSRLRPGGRTGQALLSWLNQKMFKEY